MGRFPNVIHCRVWAQVRGQSAPCNIIARLSVRSIKCMSFKEQFEWRLHVTSRPKLLVRSCPVMVAHSLPAGFDSVRKFTRSRSDQLGCVRPLCAGWFESFRLFARAGESSVSGLALFTSLKLCAPYIIMIMYMFILVHAALQAPCRSAASFRFLIALIDPAIPTQSGKSNHSA